MDKSNIEKLCNVLGDVIKIALPIIITALVADLDSKEKLEQQ